MARGNPLYGERRSIMITDWYEKTIQALQLNGKGERTQEAYARFVRMLSQFYGKTTDQISEQELQDYFLPLGILRAQTERRLPAVLSVEEVLNLLTHIKTSQNYAYLSTVYSSKWKTTPSSCDMPNPGAGG
jgi:site-specific recombinase XerD